MWNFGEAPLPETERYAAIMRRVSSLVVQMESPTEVVTDLCDLLERAEARLEGLVPTDPRPRVGDLIEAEGRVYIDHSRNVGQYNPAFPIYTLEVDADADRACGTVRFPVLYEGPPGLVHGGFLAMFFDLAIQHHNCDMDTAGKTTQLDLRYRAPTPLLEELNFEIERQVGDGRIESFAQLFRGETLCATATMRAIAGSQASLPPVSPRRTR